MKTKNTLGLAVLALSAIISACAGGGKGPESELAGLTACEPAATPVGGSVVCEAPKGLTEDCTVFIGGKPVEFVLNTEDGFFSSKAPALLPKEYSVSYQCGADEASAFAKLEIVGAGSTGSISPEEPTDVAGTGGGTTTGGDVILPGTGGTGGDTDAGTAGTGTGGTGTGGTTGGTPEPTGLTATLTVTKMFDTRLGMVKLHWAVSGGGTITELYVYSGGFYRIDADAGAANPCGFFDDGYGKRQLLVHSDGNDLIAASPNFNTWNKYMSSAQECTGAANCNGYTASLWREGAVTERLAELQLKESLKYELQEGAKITDAPLFFPMFLDDPPVCRMDLKNAGNFVASGDMYTRTLTRVPFKLYVKTSSGEEKLVTGTWAPDSTIPSATVTATATVLQNEPKISLTANFTNTLLPMSAPAGCTKVSPTSGTPNAKGTGFFEAKCNLAKSQEFALVATGIGAAGTKTERIKVEGTGIPGTFKNGSMDSTGSSPYQICAGSGNDWWKGCHQAGRLNLLGTATRSWTVSRKDDSNNWVTVGSPQEVPWIKGMKILAFSYNNASCGTIGPKTITSLEDSSLPSGVTKQSNGLLLQGKLDRNHDCTRYEFHIQDLDSSWTKVGDDVDAPYDASFDLSNGATSTSYSCMIDDCDSWADGDCCSNGPPWICGNCPSNTVHSCTDHTTYGSFNWGGRHIKSISSTCGGSFNAQPSGSNYDYQAGDWSHSQGGKSGFSCDIDATTWNGGHIHRSFGAGAWDDNC